MVVRSLPQTWVGLPFCQAAAAGQVEKAADTAAGGRGTASRHAKGAAEGTRVRGRKKQRGGGEGKEKGCSN